MTEVLLLICILGKISEICSLGIYRDAILRLRIITILISSSICPVLSKSVLDVAITCIIHLT